MYRRESIPSGIRLQQLIQNQHAEILDREKDNSRFIHLYNIGTYWVAFEWSAWRLSGIFRQCEITVFHVQTRPEYVVMASVSADEAEAYFHKHIVSRNGIYYKVLPASMLEIGDYYKWHEVAVRSVLQ